MKNLTVKEILDNPELSQTITLQNSRLFLVNGQYYDEIVKEVQEKKTVANVSGNNIVSNEILKKYHNKIDANKLMLFLGFRAMRVLQLLNRVHINSMDSEEISFGNGEFISIDDNEIKYKIDSEEEVELSAVKDKLGKTILIVANYFDNNSQKKGKKATEIKGLYTSLGTPKRIQFNENVLVDFSKGAEMMASITNEVIAEAIQKGLISKNILLKYFEKNKLGKATALDLFLREILTEDDLVKRIYRKKNLAEIAIDPTVDRILKLMLLDKGKISVGVIKEAGDGILAFEGYILKKISIKELQEILKQKQLDTDSFAFESDWNFIAAAYEEASKQQVITDTTEILTHNILDYTKSMEYLKYLQDKNLIEEEDKKYIEKLMRDFKTNELINNTENKMIEVSSSRDKKVQPHVANLTIDPQVRIDYFKSLGSVKQLIVRGESFIKDSNENVGKRNSLDGYEIFIIPSKKIAILEKLYETTRDKEGNIKYRTNKNGELIPAIENATYIMPIEMAKDFTEQKNKRDLILSPFVERSMHTADWIKNTERKIRKVNPEIVLDIQNSDEWSNKVRENYRQNKSKNDRIL